MNDSDPEAMAVAIAEALHAGDFIPFENIPFVIEIIEDILRYD